MLTLTKLERKKLRKELPKGASLKLAEKYRHTRDYINQILRGVRYNEYVLTEAMRMAQEEQERLANVKKAAGYGK
jgi:hypothetical protein